MKRINILKSHLEQPDNRLEDIVKEAGGFNKIVSLAHDAPDLINYRDKLYDATHKVYIPKDMAREMYEILRSKRWFYVEQRAYIARMAYE